jgi:disulfide bond formation protein DsbB
MPVTAVDDHEVTVPFPEVATLFLLIVPIVGWLLGVVIAWRSTVWTTRDKVVATVLGPGGLPTLVSVVLLDVTDAKGTLTSPSASQALGMGLAAAIVAASFASIVYLGVRLRANQTIAVE